MKDIVVKLEEKEHPRRQNRYIDFTSKTTKRADRPVFEYFEDFFQDLKGKLFKAFLTHICL